MSRMQLTQGLRRSADLFGDRVATIMGDRRSTWREVENRVARLATGLHGLGAQRGDRIVILALNSDRYIDAYYAILWAGCVAVPLNTRWVWAEIAHALSDSEPSLILYDAHFAHLAPELAKTCPSSPWMVQVMAARVSTRSSRRTIRCLMRAPAATISR